MYSEDFLGCTLKLGEEVMQMEGSSEGVRKVMRSSVRGNNTASH